MYIQLEKNGTSTIYAFPAVLGEGTQLLARLAQDPVVLSPAYQLAKE